MTQTMREKIQENEGINRSYHDSEIFSTVSFSAPSINLGRNFHIKLN